MTVTPPIAAPMPITEPRQLTELLSEACLGRTAWIRGGCVRWTEPGSASQLESLLREIPAGAPEGPASSGVGGHLTRKLGDEASHVAGWIALGDLYEELIGEERPPGFIFCLDAWSALLLNQRVSLSPETRWIFVDSGSSFPRDGKDAYWSETREWIHKLPLHAIVAPSALPPQAAAVRPGPPKAAQGRVIQQKPGAWKWSSIEGTPASQGSTHTKCLFSVLHAGTVDHLRVFLDSYVRAVGPHTRFTLLLLLAEESRTGIPEYLRWFRIAHPQLKIILEHAGDPSRQRSVTLDWARRTGVDRLVLLDDRAVLPQGFADLLDAPRGAASTILLGCPLNAETSAHIVIGNLDAGAHYEELLTASRPPDPRQRIPMGEIVERAEFETQGGGKPPSARPNPRLVDLLLLGVPQ